MMMVMVMMVKIIIIPDMQRLDVSDLHTMVPLGKCMCDRA